MKKRSPSLRSFGDLKNRIDMESLPNHVPHLPPPPAEEDGPLDPEEETRLFLAAVEGAERMRHDRIEPSAPGTIRKRAPLRTHQPDDTLEKLRNLVAFGKGFHVDQTPEYMEGAQRGVSPDLLQRLHRGDFTIQAHIDLHGYTQAEGREVLERFLKDAISRGRHGVLVIHGRGLCSPGEPVLKRMVMKTLSRGYWRKRVVAFASARLSDGGAGATYVLLRPYKSASG